MQTKASAALFGYQLALVFPDMTPREVLEWADIFYPQDYKPEEKPIRDHSVGEIPPLSMRWPDGR